jgi:shikimate dehydrogenase
MHPQDQDMVPFPTSWLTPEHLVVDLIYNPAETRFLREARGRGAAVLNGADMLRLQAEKAWGIWKTSGV